MLFDLLARSVEERRHRLQLLGRLADLGQRQRRRGQVVGDGQPHRIAFVAVHVADPDGAEGRCADEGAGGPARGRRRQHAQAVLHVLQYVEHQMALRPGEAGQRGLGGRREQHIEVALAGHEVVEPGRQQAAGRIGLAADRPRLAQLQGQPFLVHALVGRVGCIDLGQRAVGAAQVQLVVVEGQRAADEIALETRRVVVERRDVHVVRLAFVDDGGALQRRAALPFLGDARITRAGHAAVAEVGVHVDGIGVLPAQAALRLGTVEPVGEELLVDQVELAGLVGVGAAARQRDQAAGVVGLAAIGAVPDPVLALGLVQRVQVQHRLPLRLRLAVLGQRGAAPDTAFVLLVLPEVVVVVADLLHARDLGV